MIYTSGTTGKPKGAFAPRRRRPEPGARPCSALIGYTPDDVYLTTGPLYHSGPGGFMGIAQALGQTVVVQRKFDPEDWLRLVDTYNVTSTFSAPTPIRMICTLPDEVKANYDRRRCSGMIANAAPWSFALKQMYLADFPADSLLEVYGSTELGVNCVLEPDDQLRKPGSCGKPAPGVEIRLFDDDGNEVTGIGPDHPGELFVRSATVFADYYKQHDKYEADIRGDFHTVGDIAYRDDEGFFYICDRKKDMIISRRDEHLPGRDRGGAGAPPRHLRGGRVRHPDRGVGRDRARRGRGPPGRSLDRRRRDGASPASTSPATRSRGRSLHRRAAQDRLRQDPQARAPRAVLGRPHVTGRLSPGGDTAS